MLNLRKINPMVRAVGTMGAVSALVGGITFAQLTSNTVALSPNTLSTGTANLEIGGGRNFNNNNNNNNNDNNSNDNLSSDNSTSNNTNNTSGVNNQSANLNDTNNFNNNNDNNNRNSCRNTTNGSIPGFNLTGQNGLLPGEQSDPIRFCLKNTSNVPLDLTVAIPDDPFANASGLQPSDVELTITCSTGSTSDTLDAYVNTTGDETLGTLDANSSTNCRATVELVSGTTDTGTLPSFDIEFEGTTTS